MNSAGIPANPGRRHNNGVEIMLKRVLAAILFGTPLSTAAIAQGNPMCSNVAEAASWPADQDAVVAAPDNHKVLFENDDIRVLQVSVRAGEREKTHHHKYPSVMIVHSRPSYKNYDKQGNEIPPATVPAEMPVVARLPAQAAHAIQVFDSRPFMAIRVELKKLCQP